jgi:hypothetical protein
MDEDDKDDVIWLKPRFCLPGAWSVSESGESLYIIFINTQRAPDQVSTQCLFIEDLTEEDDGKYSETIHALMEGV